MVKHIPREVIIEVLLQTIEVQSQGKAAEMTKILGGMKVAGEDEKKKTAGGVFLALIKKSPR